MAWKKNSWKRKTDHIYDHTASPRVRVTAIWSLILRGYAGQRTSTASKLPKTLLWKPWARLTRCALKLGTIRSCAAAHLHRLSSRIWSERARSNLSLRKLNNAASANTSGGWERGWETRTERTEQRSYFPFGATERALVRFSIPSCGKRQCRVPARTISWRLHGQKVSFIKGMHLTTCFRALSHQDCGDRLQIEKTRLQPTRSRPLIIHISACVDMVQKDRKNLHPLGPNADWLKFTKCTLFIFPYTSFGHSLSLHLFFLSNAIYDYSFIYVFFWQELLSQMTYVVSFLTCKGLKDLLDCPTEVLWQDLNSQPSK